MLWIGVSLPKRATCSGTNRPTWAKGAASMRKRLTLIVLAYQVVEFVFDRPLDELGKGELLGRRQRHDRVPGTLEQILWELKRGPRLCGLRRHFYPGALLHRVRPLGPCWRDPVVYRGRDVRA